jgi:glycosyltransferase involved in cell wall biosynthesis
MRVAVVTSDVPFVTGGHLTIARCLKLALQESGHEADIVLTPQNRFGHQFRAYLANRFYDLTEDGFGRKIQQVISLRFPSFAVHHPAHVSWLNHRLREYYDLWDMLYSQLSWKGKIKETFRRSMIHKLDAHLLKHNVNKVFAQSQTIQERLLRWGKIPSKVLYPPPPQRAYFTEGYEDFIFAVSRLQKLKRLNLLVEAFKYVKNKTLKAYIIGEGPEEQALKNMIFDNNLEKRVILLGLTDEKTVLNHFARCRAVFFAPLREDYGFVTGEAFASRKAVITTKDSGGPAELVQDGSSGFIVSSDPQKIAEKFDTLSEDRSKAEKMGKHGFEFMSKITWEDTVQHLLLKQP